MGVKDDDDDVGVVDAWSGEGTVKDDRRDPEEAPPPPPVDEPDGVKAPRGEMRNGKVVAEATPSLPPYCCEGFVGVWKLLPICDCD